jgi:hypothetical protein
MDADRTMRQSPWGLAVVALLGLAGCLPASRGWVQAQIAPVQTQVAEVRDRVAAVEHQFGRLDPKVDRILAEMEHQWQQSLVSSQHPADTRVTGAFSSPSHHPGNLPVKANLDLAISGGATPAVGRTTPPIGGTTPPDCLLKTLKGEPCSGRTTPRRPAPVKALKPPPPSGAAPSDCLLKTLKGEPC